MAFIGPLRAPKRGPIPIDARAVDHLRYIRETMERAAEFTAVPGWGGVAMGLTAIAAAWIASRQASPRGWLTVWLVEAFVAVSIAASSAATKAHRGSARLLSGPGRKFLLSFTPPIIVGGLLTFALFQAGRSGYGAGYHGSGSDSSVRAVQLGRRVDGCGLWSSADLFWFVDRSASRRIAAEIEEGWHG
jgi:hypothetical protein